MANQPNKMKGKGRSTEAARRDSNMSRSCDQLEQQKRDLLEQERYVRIEDLVELQESSTLLQGSELGHLQAQIHELAIQYELKNKST